MSEKCCRPMWANVLLSIAFAILLLSVSYGVVCVSLFAKLGY